MMRLVPLAVSRTVGRTLLKTKKNSPHILFAVGVTGVVTSTVLACRATLKLDKDLDEIKKEVSDVKELRKMSEETDGAYSDQDYYQDLGRVYIKSGLRLGRLYGPALVVGVASVSALTGSHVQLTRRNTALTATIASVSQAYEAYRERIREELGEDRERDIFHGVEEQKLIGGKKALALVNPTGYSPYARIFDETCECWQKNDPEKNRFFLQGQQNYANHLLNSRGHVFLNDVYDLLGFQRTKEGAVMGWLRDDVTEGDGFIDFGLFDASAARFINGLEHAVILDFNVDGVVFDKI